MKSVALVLCLAISTAAFSCPAFSTCVCDTNPCDTMKCDADKSCEASVLVCDSTRCHMDCGGKQSCIASHLQCVGDYCQIRCVQDLACEGLMTYSQRQIYSDTQSLDSDGKHYGMWMGAKASEGKLICDGQKACQASKIGCASDNCEVHCNGVQSCQANTFVIKDTVESTLHRCTNTQACQQTEFDYSDAGGDSVLWCDNVQACLKATVKCPRRHSLTIKCQSKESCKAMTIVRYSDTPSDKECKLECVGQDACVDITDDRTPVPALPPCSNWVLKVPVVSINCDNLCVGILDISLCKEHCVCADTNVPATNAPAVLTLKKLFKLILGILLTDLSVFLRLLQALLSTLVTSLKVYWTCPAAACIGGCPDTAVLKLAAGCKAIVESLTGRFSDALADDGTVVLFEPTYSSDGTEDKVTAAVEAEIASPTTLKDYKVESVESNVATTVYEDATASPLIDDDDDGGDGIAPGIIALIIILSVLFIVAIVVVVVFFVCRKSSETVSCNAPDRTHECNSFGPEETVV